jgi:hypothetical protein
MNKGNGSVLFEVSNRGGKGILHIVNGVTSSDPKAEFGDGFLMREGYTIAWVGWEADLAEQGDRLRLVAPVAHDPAGKPIRGLVRSDFTPAQNWKTCLSDIFSSDQQAERAIRSTIRTMRTIF